jgi:hypothetical protein
MPVVTLAPGPLLRGLDANGNPINGGKLFAYIAGTTTKQDTYTTASGSVANTNPVVLDSSGRASVFLDTSLSYKLVLAPSERYGSARLSHLDSGQHHLGPGVSDGHSAWSGRGLRRNCSG